MSSTRKPISYINLAKRFLQEHGEVQLSALGIAVAPMVTVAEILKNRRRWKHFLMTTGVHGPCKPCRLPYLCNDQSCPACWLCANFVQSHQ